jgi:hypothetical protein
MGMFCCLLRSAAGQRRDVVGRIEDLDTIRGDDVTSRHSPFAVFLDAQRPRLRVIHLQENFL